jgi:hypothetical protein
MKKQTNLIGNNISRLGMEYIRLPTGLLILMKEYPAYAGITVRVR